ncbi:MAG: hypothetical protein HC837_03225 [Chloroflexaceae bacterium]|nr:hypothetical protein [Chloroflexaceae bacterium]
MNTPSHLIITAATQKFYRRTPIVRSAFLLGSVAPDLPLIVLWVSSTIHLHYNQGWTIRAAFRYLEQLYFVDPIWIAAHNTLHSPTMLVLLLLPLWHYRQRINSWGRWMYWFLLACLLHSVIDIATHGNDGPLLLFPFQWSIRFYSPVSYWDPAYYGREFALFELVLTIGLLTYLFGASVWRRVMEYRAKPVTYDAH